jgi:TorA maturation chaperone TorD
MTQRAELFSALGLIAETPRPHRELWSILAAGDEGPGSDRAGHFDADELAAAHTECFSFQLVPYASVYLSPDGMLGGEAADRIAGFWRALHSSPPFEPDHLASLLGAYASLLSQLSPEGHTGAVQRVRATMLFEHLCSWLPIYLLEVIRLGGPYGTIWAPTLLALITEEAATVAAVSPLPRTPLALREVPPLGFVSGGASEPTSIRELIDAVLSPARSGFIVTRADLKLVASRLGLGMRLGERRYILRALIDQDGPSVLSALAELGLEAAQRTSALERSPGLEAAAAHFRVRAEATALALQRLSSRAALV